MNPIRPCSSAQHATIFARSTIFVVAVIVALAIAFAGGATASAQTPDVPAPTIDLPTAPTPVPDTPAPGTQTEQPTDTTTPGDGALNLSIDLGGNADGSIPSQSILLLLVLTVLSVAPSLVVLMTSFTRIVIVLSLVRNALGLQTIPPNQVVVGLSLFLSLFIMSPTFQEMNDQGLQPYLNGEISQGEAYTAAAGPLRSFMMDNTGADELKLMISADTTVQNPEGPDDIPMLTLIPAFILSELKTAFIIGFVVFMPFLIIDLVVSSVLMSLGMMMLPPVFVSLPFKILLFVLVNGWVLIASTLINGFNMG